MFFASKLYLLISEYNIQVRGRHKRVPCDDPQDFRGQPDDEADQRRHLHLQPAYGTAIPQDYPHQCVGWTEASWTGQISFTLFFFIIYTRHIYKRQH